MNGRNAMTMLALDDIIMLTASQMGRKLFVPIRMAANDFSLAVNNAVWSGMLKTSQFQGGPSDDSSIAIAYEMTHEGWLRYGKLTDCNVVFLDVAAEILSEEHNKVHASDSAVDLEDKPCDCGVCKP